MDFIDPIIKAMIARQQNMQAQASEKNNQQKLVEETRSAKAREAATQHAQDLLEAENQRTHDIALQHLEIERKRSEAELETHRITRSLQIGQALRTGDIKAPTQHVGVPGVMGQDVPQKFNLPGTNTTVDPSIYSNPEEAGARTLKLKADEAMAQRKAMEDQLNFQNRLQPSPTVTAQLQNAKDIASQNVGGRQEVAETKADADLKRAQATALLHGAANGADSATTEGMRKQFATGEAIPSLSNKTQAAVAGALAKEGYQTGKSLQDRVNQYRRLQALEPVIGRYEQFTNDYLSDKPLGAFGTSLASHIPGFDIKGASEAVNSDIINIIKDIEGGTGGRQLAGAFKAELGGTPLSNDTKKGALKKVNNLRQRVLEAKKNLLKGIPDAQLEDLKSIGIEPPASANTSQQNYQHIRANAAGHQIGSNDGVNWFDVKTGAKIQ